MKQYECEDCKTLYNDNNIPNDFICRDPNCPGGGLTGLIMECIEPQAERELGLCILLMDASGSMNDKAFADHPSSKRQIIANNAAVAIFDLNQMLKKKDAYIMAIKFDERQEVMFTKSIDEIISEFGTAQNLASHFDAELQRMGGGTNINAALNLAFEKQNEFLQGKTPELGHYEPLYHTQYLSRLHDTTDIPNVRTLMYTDGEQLKQYGSIKNPFVNAEIDLLTGIYFGEENAQGCLDLKSCISLCPIHNTPQFFTVASARDVQTLRGLFRMASGTSGFCPSCLENLPSQLR